MTRAWMSGSDVRAVVERTLPFYYTTSSSFLPGISDKALSLLMPVLVYWGASLAFHVLDVVQPRWAAPYRLHTPEELQKRNRVGMKRVILMVMLQHAIQTLLGVLIMEDTPSVGGRRLDVNPYADVQQLLSVLRIAHRYVDVSDVVLVRAAVALYWWGLPWVQFWFACIVMDAWQYLLHRTMHEVRFLYRMMHSHHHRLYVPYAFGALYNHPLEGMLLDTLGAELSRLASLMTLRQTVVFFTLSTLKTVCDHGGYAFPWYYNPLQILFPNDAEYHDVHHHALGLRYNYSQPYFVHFDTVLGTRVDPADFRAMLAKKELKLERDQPVPADDVARATSVAAHAAHAAHAGADAPAAETSRQRENLDAADATSALENAHRLRTPPPRAHSPYTTGTWRSWTLWAVLLYGPIIAYAYS